MKKLKLMFPVLVLVAGIGINVVPSFATAEYTKKEKKPCGTCHTAKAPKKGGDVGLNDIGKCYEKEKSMAKCAK